MPLIILATITFGVMVWYSLPAKQPTAINLVGESSGTVTFSFDPSSLTLKPGQESTLTLNIDTTTSHVTGAQIDLMYDKSKLGTPVVTLGNFLPNTLSQVKVDDKTISFVVAAPPDSGGKIGHGPLAIIKIKPPKEGVSTLQFSEMNAAFGIGSQSNLLKEARDLEIKVVAPAKPSKPTGLRSNCFAGGKKITLRWDSVTDVTSYKVRLNQIDGNDDKSFDNIGDTDHEFDLIPGQKYSWWVHSTKDGLDSDEARIEEVICQAELSTPTPTPSPTPKPTVKPTLKPTVKPAASKKPSESPRASLTPSSTPSTLSTAPQVAPGSLNDIFKDKAEVAGTGKESAAKPGLFKQISLGWQSLLNALANLFK